MRSHQRALVRFGMMAAGCVLLAVPSQGETPTNAFAVYQSDQPQLPLRLEYPTGWDVELSSGKMEPYTQVQFYAPASLESRLRIYLVARALPPKAAGGRYADVGELAASYRASLPPTFAINGERATTVLGVSARQVGVAGTLQLPWMSSNAHPVSVVGQRVFCERAGRLYEFAWLATPAAAPQVEAAFMHLLETLAPLE